MQFIAHNLIDDTDLFDHNGEIIALPHTPPPRNERSPAYIVLLARIMELQADHHYGQASKQLQCAS